MLVYKFNSDEQTTIDMGLEKNENAKFINVLGRGQRELLIKQERINRKMDKDEKEEEKMPGFSKLDDKFFKELQEIEGCHSDCRASLLGTHTYSILDNSQY